MAANTEPLQENINRSFVGGHGAPGGKKPTLTRNGINTSTAYFRVTCTTLGAAYGRFLRQFVRAGGLLVLAEYPQSWPTTRIGDRHVFQVGAVGGMEPEESTLGPVTGP